MSKKKGNSAGAKASGKVKINMLKKLSVKTLIGGKAAIQKLLGDEDEQILLFTAYGIINGVREGSTDMGGGKVSTWQALVGDIEAVRAADGKTFRGPQVFVPEPVNGMIAGAIKSGSGNVRFAVEVSVARKESAIAGYEYFANPLMDTAASDVLAELRVEAGFKALPAPAAA